MENNIIITETETTETTTAAETENAITAAETENAAVVETAAITETETVTENAETEMEAAEPKRQLTLDEFVELYNDTSNTITADDARLLRENIDEALKLRRKEDKKNAVAALQAMTAAAAFAAYIKSGMTYNSVKVSENDDGHLTLETTPLRLKWADLDGKFNKIAQDSHAHDGLEYLWCNLVRYTDETLENRGEKRSFTVAEAAKDETGKKRFGFMPENFKDIPWASCAHKDMIRQLEAVYRMLIPNGFVWERDGEVIKGEDIHARNKDMRAVELAFRNCQRGNLDGKVWDVKTLADLVIVAIRKQLIGEEYKTDAKGKLVAE